MCVIVVSSRCGMVARKLRSDGCSLAGSSRILAKTLLVIAQHLALKQAHVGTSNF